MLEPPTRSHSVSSSNDVGNTLVDSNIPSFKTSHGTFKGVDCVLVALPIPHATEHTSGPINPLLCDSLAPSTHTAGVRVSIAHFEAGRAPRKTPRNSLNRNKSSFISRASAYDRLTRLLKQDFESMWVSVGRSVQLLPFGPVKSDPLWRVLFTKAWPICHVAGPGLELVCGMSSGDIVWLDAHSNKYTRLNKAGNLTRAAVTSIAWFGPDQTQVVAGHADGSVAIYELDREDGADVILQPQKGAVLVQLYAPPQPGTNPVQAFKISNAPITDVLVQGELVYCTSRDGYLRALHTEDHVVGPLVHSEYGGMFGVAMSPDNKFLLAGGEDDAVYVYEPLKMQQLCKLVGHSSWVRRIKFDPFNSDSSLYKAASVAEDGKLLLWEFDNETLLEGNSILFPMATITPSLPKVSQVPLTDVFFQKESISAAGSDGRVWTWQRPESA